MRLGVASRWAMTAIGFAFLALLWSQTAEAQAPTLDRVVAIGTRRSDATALTSSAPVDVINAEELKQTGATSLNQALFQLLPSFNFPQNNSATRGQDPKGASLRGLSPDQTLVLINGKRRHTSAVVNISGGVPFIGAQPVDLDMIPRTTEFAFVGREPLDQLGTDDGAVLVRGDVFDLLERLGFEGDSAEFRIKRGQ